MTIKYDTNGLVPAIIQDANTDQVLMLGYMNEEAVSETKSRGNVVFFSRSRQRLWEKGETSGNYLKFVSMSADCDEDALLIKAIPQGPTCHKGTTTCWGEGDKGALGFVAQLEGVIADRKLNPDENSYTTSLFEKGVPKIAQKVGEEATEVVIEAVKGDKERLISESADLLFHWLVLLRSQDLELADVVKELEKRH